MGDEQPIEPRKAGRNIEPRTIGLIVLVVALLGFALANTEETTVSFVFFDVTAPLIFVLLGTAVLGAVVGGLLGHLRRRRRGD
jgi:uncharacterized integral membrane protein